MKKRKDQLTQRVRFREDLVQESPVKKSFLKELEGVIKIGDFFCPMVPPRNSWRFNSAQTANPKSHISVDFVFRRLKDSLRFDSGCPILSMDHGVLELEHVKHSDLERAPSPNVKCTRCLALAILAETAGAKFDAGAATTMGTCVVSIFNGDYAIIVIGLLSIT
jgi:hypothetical protein